MSETDRLRAAAAQLRKSERGARFMENLIRLHDDGGAGLDAFNKAAAAELILCMFSNPWDWPAEFTNRDKEQSA